MHELFVFLSERLISELFVFLVCIFEMKSREKKVCGNVGIDRISSLPESLIDYILNCLSEDEIGTVVRTSVLSKRWRYCWTRVRKVLFYLELFEKNAEQLQLDGVSIVDSILSRHDGPVDTFTFSALNLTRDRKYDVSKWIKLLSEKRIGEFNFHATSLCYMGSPSCFMNCVTLTRLNLQNCYFGPLGDFGGFSNLTYLRLANVNMISGPLLETWISSSPRLSDLRLKHLPIEDYHVVIHAPCLHTLYLRLSGNHSLKEFPNMNYASVNSEFEVPLVSHKRVSKIVNFAKLMPKVEYLKLSGTALMSLAVEDVPKKLPTTLDNVTVLKFRDLDIVSLEQLSSFFCLIRSSPNLKSLEIKLDSFEADDPDYEEEAVSFFKEQEKEGILSHLSEITFLILLGCDCEVEFISTLLNCCPMLKKVTFSSFYDSDRDSDEKMFNKLRALPRPESVTFRFQSPCLNDGHLFTENFLRSEEGTPAQ